MKIEGDWIVDAVEGKASTDKASGNKIKLSQADSDLKSEQYKQSQARERFGTLKLTGAVNMEMDGKLLERAVYAEAADEDGRHVYQFVPAKRLKADEFTSLYMAIDKAVTVEFEDAQGELAFNENEPETSEAK